VRMAWAAALALLVSSPHEALGQQPDSAVPADFTDFEFIQYITAPHSTPQNILRLDNNGEIVLAARGGVTRSQLEVLGVSFSESQIALLKTWRLLKEEGDTLASLIPILGPEDTRRLRRRIQTAASAIAAELHPAVSRLQTELGKTGRAHNAYTIIFSYVLDGLVWDEFEKHGVLDNREVTAETPLWSGYVWALYPPRTFSPGTNTISDEGISLKVAWAEATLPKMRPFVADIPTLVRMFNDYKERGRVEDERVREVFGLFGLFDETGRFTIPVIAENDSNRLYKLAKTVAEGVAAEAPTLLDLPLLATEFGFRDERQALVVAYHELMWEILDRLEADGLVQRPVAFAEPDQARPVDIAALVFIVRGSE